MVNIYVIISHKFCFFLFNSSAYILVSAYIVVCLQVGGDDRGKLKRLFILLKPSTVFLFNRRYEAIQCSSGSSILLSLSLDLQNFACTA